MKANAKLILNTIGATMTFIFIVFVAGLMVGVTQQVKVTVPTTILVTNTPPVVNVYVTNTFNVLIVPSGNIAPDDSDSDDSAAPTQPSI